MSASPFLQPAMADAAAAAAQMVFTIIFFVGPVGGGKTTSAKCLVKFLTANGIPCRQIDGDTGDTENEDPRLKAVLEPRIFGGVSGNDRAFALLTLAHDCFARGEIPILSCNTFHAEYIVNALNKHKDSSYSVKPMVYLVGPTSRDHPAFAGFYENFKLIRQESGFQDALNSFFGAFPKFKAAMGNLGISINGLAHDWKIADVPEFDKLPLNIPKDTNKWSGNFCTYLASSKREKGGKKKGKGEAASVASGADAELVPHLGHITTNHGLKVKSLDPNFPQKINAKRISGETTIEIEENKKIVVIKIMFDIFIFDHGEKLFHSTVLINCTGRNPMSWWANLVAEQFRGVLSGPPPPGVEVADAVLEVVSVHF